MSEARRAIETLQELLNELDFMRQQLDRPFAQAECQWNALGRCAAQRNDAAAELLAQLIEPLKNMRRFLSASIVRIEKIKRDPFKED